MAPAAGIVLTLVWELRILPNPIPGFPGLATAFLVNVLLFVGISYLTKPQAPKKSGAISQIDGEAALTAVLEILPLCAALTGL